jgi:deoxyribose-phosphate aldolase
LGVGRFAKLFDHSIVRPDATRADVERAAATAVALGTATLTVQPCYIALARDLLVGSDVLLGSVVGFPHGNETPEMKCDQASRVLDLGAREIDMVMNIPALKNGDQALFLRDIEGVVREAGPSVVVKVITENCFLDERDKRRACDWIARTSAGYVRTSTAYGPGGATLDDVRLMHDAVAGRCLVKAAGGVKTLDDVLAYLRAGARRFGSTRSDQFTRAYAALSPDAARAFADYVEAA